MSKNGTMKQNNGLFTNIDSINFPLFQHLRLSNPLDSSKISLWTHDLIVNIPDFIHSFLTLNLFSTQHWLVMGAWGHIFSILVRDLRHCAPVASLQKIFTFNSWMSLLDISSTQISNLRPYSSIGSKSLKLLFPPHRKFNGLKNLFLVMSPNYNFSHTLTLIHHF